MTDQSKGKRGEAAWREEREAISSRNVEARRRGRAERESREGLRAARLRADAQREAQQLRKLNAEIGSRQGGLSR